MRHRVQAIAEGDVVVDVDRRLLPLGQLVGVRRQRQQRRTLDRLEELETALAVLPHAAAVQVGETLSDGFVERRERVEYSVAQSREHPALHDLYSDLHLGFRKGCRLQGIRTLRLKLSGSAVACSALQPPSLHASATVPS